MLPRGWIRATAAGRNGNQLQSRNEEARSIKAGFCRERRYANLGHLLPSLYRASGETRCVGPPSSLIDQPLLL